MKGVGVLTECVGSRVRRVTSRGTRWRREGGDGGFLPGLGSWDRGWRMGWGRLHFDTRHSLLVDGLRHCFKYWIWHSRTSFVSESRADESSSLHARFKLVFKRRYL